MTVADFAPIAIVVSVVLRLRKLYCCQVVHFADIRSGEKMCPSVLLKRDLMFVFVVY